MKTKIITLLAVGLCVGVLLGHSATANANIPPRLESGSPGSIDGRHLCFKCRLVDEGGPGAAMRAPQSQPVDDIVFQTTEPRSDLRWISWRIIRLAFSARLF